MAVPRAIFDREPGDWRDLQNLVAQMFRELGCEVFVSEHVELVRGRKEIDVRVRDPGTTPVSQYLCECKFWTRAIPQEVIHAFRTVVGDYGAHRGFIVFRAGFQAGAHDAVRNTNIDLITFSELQSIFFECWNASMCARFMPYADRLFPYWDFPGKKPSIPWGKEHVEAQQRLIDAYRPLIILGPGLEMAGWRWQLPMTLPSLDQRRNFNGEIALRTYRSVYDFIEAKKDLALRDFQIVYGEVPE